MSWMIYGVIAFAGLVVGSLTSWILTEYRYYKLFNDLKDKTDSELKELKAAVARNTLGLAEEVKKLLNESLAEFDGNPQLTELRDSFVRRLDEQMAKAEGNPITLTLIAWKCLPAMIQAFVHAKTAVEETRRTRQGYDGLIGALQTMSADFWKLVRAVIGQGVNPDELEEVGRRLSEAHRALGERGLTAGLSQLSEVFAEMTRLVQGRLPERKDDAEEVN